MPTPIDLHRFTQIKATGHLPSPRGVALAIMRMAQDEAVSTAELARTIKGDPAFVGRLIKVANGMLARRRAIVSVQEALMVVGLSAVRAMVLGFSLLSNYRRGNCPGFDYPRFWSSSLIMAIAMQVLALRTCVVAADESFSVGLLARIGELALATVYPSKYGRLLIEASANPESDLLELERQALAITHAELGAAMLADWGMPAMFSSPVRYLDHPEQAPYTAEEREMVLVQSLVLARSVADICLGPPARQHDLMVKASRLAAHLGCPREIFVADCAEIARQWGEWSKLLQFEATELPAFESLCDGEADQLLGQKVADSDAAAANEPLPPPTSHLRAMVVTACADDRAQLTKILSRREMRVFEHSSLAGVMEQVLDVQPHMLVLDGDDPVHACRLIRALRATRIGRGIYILLLLSADDEAQMSIFEAGADDFFIKPVGPKMLQTRLDAARRIVQLQRELEHEREDLRHFANELAISNRCLQEAALTDPLTGLPNRRYAMERMQQEWQAAHRTQRTLACMVIDLDGFKQINDDHGHDVGDMALREASEALRRVLRGQDVICRTGGDEFLVICPETSLEDAMTCGERLRGGIDCLSVGHEGRTLTLTISVGVAVRDTTILDVNALIKKADAAAYLAKRLGRNKVVAAVE
jgi:diguanylate cyclase (GGDEF)-like protein